ncbi:MAG: hypothetical protein QNJ62_06210 [Methyloceanibacter sp.]|nr:hypothetical protein [Methyloceanibacter sp.]
MPSHLSAVQIANMAVDYLEESPITALTDDSDTARWLNRNFEPARDGLLRGYGWNFALKRAAVASNGTPEFGWKYQYPLPNDCLRILPLKINGELNGRDIPHEIEDNHILTNEGAPLKIRYIKRVEDTGQFDSLFAEALAARLAMKMAHWMTGKTSYFDRAVEAYRTALEEARLIDALEGTPEDTVDDAWVDIR